MKTEITAMILAGCIVFGGFVAMCVVGALAVNMIFGG